MQIGNVVTAGLDPATARELNHLVGPLQQIQKWGAWLEWPYVDSTYFATTGTWTVARVHLLAYYYTVQNGLMHVNIAIAGSTTSAGMGGELFIRLPDGYGVLPSVSTVGLINWNGGALNPPGLVTVSFTGATANCLRLLVDNGATTAWPSAATVNLGICATVPVYQV